MTKAELLKFLEPFTDDTKIEIELDDGISQTSVKFEPVYKLIDGEGIVFLYVDEEEI